MACFLRLQSRLKSTTTSLVALLVLSFFAAVSAEGTTITYEDTLFADTDWSTQVLSQQGPMTGTFTQIAFGNPTPSRMNDYTSSGVFSAENFLTAGHFNAKFVWDPAVHGAIDRLDFSYDLITTQAIAPGFDMGFRPAMRQNGTAFYLSTLFHTNPSLVAWGTYTSSSSSAAEWRDTSGLLNPDFSSSGTPIAFGYRTGFGVVCNFPPCGGTFQLRSALDNYRVTIRSLEDDGGDPGSIPEPSTAALVSSILLAGAFCRRLWVGHFTSRESDSRGPMDSSANH